MSYQPPVGGSSASGSASGDLSGTYPGPNVAKINGVALSGTPASGMVPVATGSAAATWQIPPTGGGTIRTDTIPFNVKDYGAIGNGGADDTASIHAARNAAGTGGTVFLPNGTYIVSSLALNVARQSWILNPGAVIKQKAATTTISTIIISADAVRFTGGTIDGNKTNQTYVWSGGITVQGSNVTVSDVEITNCFASGITLDATSGPACTGNLIMRNYCHDNGKDTNAADGILLASATRARVINNRCEYNGSGGGANEPAYDGNGIQDFTPSPVVTYNLIAGNQCSFNARRGIKIQSVGTSVIGNILVRNSCGIGCTDLPGGGNAAETLISGNTISDSYLQGLQLDDCQHITITGNQIIDSGSHGVGASGGPNGVCDYITFTGNTVLRSALDGIHIVGSTSWIISSNSILTNSQWGVALDSTVSKVNLTGNMWIGNSSGTLTTGGATGVIQTANMT